MQGRVRARIGRVALSNFTLLQTTALCYNGVMGAENMDRRKRINRLKKCVLFLALFLLMLPIVLCMFMTYRMSKMQEQIEELKQTVDVLSQTKTETVYVATGEGFTPSGAGSLTLPEGEYEETDGGILHKDGIRRVYLTFDDGPSANTEEILEVLERYDVKATFFVLGKEDAVSKERLLKIANAGHSIGMHSYSHVYSDIYASKEAFMEDFEKIREYIRTSTGIESEIYRFPGGSSNSVSKVPMETLTDLLEEEGVRVFDWNISSKDASGKGLTAAQIASNCLEGIEDKQHVIILMHDAAEKDATVEALPRVIESIMALPDTVILPITEETEPVLHIQR